MANGLKKNESIAVFMWDANEMLLGSIRTLYDQGQESDVLLPLARVYNTQREVYLLINQERSLLQLPTSSGSTSRPTTGLQPTRLPQSLRPFARTSGSPSLAGSALQRATVLTGTRARLASAPSTLGKPSRPTSEPAARPSRSATKAHGAAAATRAGAATVATTATAHATDAPTRSVGGTTRANAIAHPATLAKAKARSKRGRSETRTPAAAVAASGAGLGEMVAPIAIAAGMARRLGAGSAIPPAMARILTPIRTRAPATRLRPSGPGVDVTLHKTISAAGGSPHRPAARRTAPTAGPLTGISIGAGPHRRLSGDQPPAQSQRWYRLPPWRVYGVALHELARVHHVTPDHPPSPNTRGD